MDPSGAGFRGGDCGARAVRGQRCDTWCVGGPVTAAISFVVGTVALLLALPVARERRRPSRLLRECRGGHRLEAFLGRST